MKNLKETWQTCEVAKTESGYKARVRAMMKQIDQNEEFAGNCHVTLTPHGLTYLLTSLAFWGFQRIIKLIYLPN